MPRPTLLESPTRLKNSWNGHSGATCHWKTQTTLRSLTKHQNNIHNTDDHRKPKLASHPWEVRHLSRSLDNARYGMAPREGHLNATKRILGYLWAYPKISIRYDARLPDFTAYRTTTYDWFWSYRRPQKHFRTTCLSHVGSW